MRFSVYASLSLAALIVGAALSFIVIPIQAAPVQDVYTPAPRNLREQFAVDLLAALGNTQPTADTVAFVVAWTEAEDRSDDALDRFNALNTTQTGYGEYVTINGDGVKGYPDYASGLAATVQTLTNGKYPHIVYGLQTNNPELALDDAELGTWGTGRGNVEAVWRAATAAESIQPAPSAGGKHPPTDTMTVSANFYATGSVAWAGQAGGMHLGTDFAGNPGDNVYMPFDCVFDQTGFYDDSARWGHFLICHFADGTLFYSGHLQDVIQPAPGTLIPAGTIIGHIGQLYHTHIKLEPPGSPSPCEGAGTCEDFEAYYATH